MDGVAEDGEFGGKEVQELAVVEVWVVEDVEFELAHGVFVGGDDGDGEIDDGVDDGLHDHAAVLAAAQDRVFGAESLEDHVFDFVGGMLEEGDYGVVGQEEDADLLDADGEALGGEGGVLLEIDDAVEVVAAAVSLEGAD